VSPDVSEAILPGWQRCDPGALDVIEVGRHGELVSRASGARALVLPYRVSYSRDVASSCGRAVRPVAPRTGLAVLVVQPDDGWRVLEVRTRPPGSSLRVPSRGGRPVATASFAVWVIGLLVGVALCGAIAVIMAATPRPAPVPSEPVDTAEARGL